MVPKPMSSTGVVVAALAALLAFTDVLVVVRPVFDPDSMARVRDPVDTLPSIELAVGNEVNG